MVSNVVIFCAVALIVAPIPSYGCHTANQRSLSFDNKKSTIAKTISRCLSYSAGKGFRWEAIVRFSIEDTNCYDETGNSYCIHDQDTYECWRKKVDFLIDEYSPYSVHVKRCMREYEIQERPLPKLDFDNSALQAARSGRRKRDMSPADLLLTLQRLELAARSGHTSLTPRPSTQSSTQTTNTIFSATNGPTASDMLTYKPALKWGQAQVETSSRSSSYSSTKAEPTVTYLLNSQVLPTQRSSDYTVGTSWPSPTVYSFATWSSALRGLGTTQVPVGYRTSTALKENPSILPHWMRTTEPTRTVTMSVSSTSSPTRFSFATRRNCIYSNHQAPYQPPSHTYSPWRPNNQASYQPPTHTYPPWRPNNQASYQPSSHTYPPWRPNNQASYQPPSHTYPSWSPSTYRPHPTTTVTPSPYSEILSLFPNLFQGIAETDKPSVGLPLITGMMCDQESMTRFLNCVKGELGTSGNGRRFLSSQSPDDVLSICVFFKDNYSKCAPSDSWGMQQCRRPSARRGSKTCLPTIMLKLVKTSSRLRNVFQSCDL